MKDKKLEKWKNSDEWKKILTEFKNKVENLEAQIESVYNTDKDTTWVSWSESCIDDLKHKLTHNEFDVKDLWVEFINEVFFKIKKTENNKKLIEYYEDRLKNSRLFLFVPINQYWQSNSILRYTELDMIRFERSHYAWFEDTIDSLIGSDDKEIWPVGAH